MRTRTITLATLGLIVVGGVAGTNASPEPGRFIQDRFAIGFWVDPPADGNMDQSYADIAAADFTLVIGGFGANTPETVKKQIQLCEKYGMKALVARTGLQPEQLPESPAVWGYMLRDEPNASDFPGLRETVDGIRRARPGKLAYINLFPDYAAESQLGTKNYDEYVGKFVGFRRGTVVSSAAKMTAEAARHHSTPNRWIRTC